MFDGRELMLKPASPKEEIMKKFYRSASMDHYYHNHRHAFLSRHEYSENTMNDHDTFHGDDKNREDVKKNRRVTSVRCTQRNVCCLSVGDFVVNSPL